VFNDRRRRIEQDLCDHDAQRQLSTRRARTPDSGWVKLFGCLVRARVASRRVASRRLASTRAEELFGVGLQIDISNALFDSIEF
jgi:hypothetical protein